MSTTVVIDCFPESASAYGGSCAVVAVDVIRATTTAVTGVGLGRECFVASTIDAAVYVACLRNYRAQAAHLAAHHAEVAVIGAGSRGEFREEDQLCCAWIAEELVRAGYTPKDANTAEIIERWTRADLEAITRGKSAEYLRRTGQLKDLEFITTHIDDLRDVFRIEGGRVVRLRSRLEAASHRATDQASVSR